MNIPTRIKSKRGQKHEIILSCLYSYLMVLLILVMIIIVGVAGEPYAVRD